MKIFDSEALATSAVAIALILNASGADTAQFKPRYSIVAPGVEYAHLRTAEPWSIHIARMDRHRSDLDLVTTLAKGTVTGLAPVSDQVAALPASAGKPLVSINADFFTPGGASQGLHIMNGRLIRGPSRASFWMDGERNYFIDTVTATFTATWPDGDGATIPILLNLPRTNGGAVLFTRIFDSTTGTSNGLDMVLEPLDATNWELKPGAAVQSRVAELKMGGGGTLTANSAVLSLGPDVNRGIAAATVGATIQISAQLSHDLSGARLAVGGGPVLLRNGEIHPPPNQLRHPRTAIGFNRSQLFFVVVDGRQPDLSTGMIFAELSELMKQLGCTEAMNLDGGGSSTFWLKGKIMNSPSDKRERAVANGLVMVRRE